MTESDFFEIQILQKSNFPRTMPLEILLGNSLRFGCFHRLHFVRERMGQNGFVAYLPEAIGRGIRVVWTPKEDHCIQMTLPLPAAKEEISAFKDMVLRAAKEWTCAILLNGEGITTRGLAEIQEELETVNMRVLREAMQTINKDPKRTLPMPCVMHTITIGSREADRFRDDTTTEAFGRWLHMMQKRIAYIPEAEIVEYRGIKTGLYTFVSDLPVIFPLKPVLPPEYIDPRNGRPTILPEIFLVRMYGTNSGRTFGYLTMNEVTDRVPRDKVTYYDAASIMVEPLDEETLAGMVREDRSHDG